VSTYDFQRAVEDQATVPLYYDARGEKLGLAIGDINERIAEQLEALEIEDIDVAQRLEQELRRDYHIITANERLDQIARDFVNHYSQAWESGKAMLVCIDKITCVRMHQLIDFYWQEKIQELEADSTGIVDLDEKEARARHLCWMRETRMAVVISEEQGEVDKFRQWDLDILPHRRLIKEGMDLPESLRQKPEYHNMQRMSLDDAFKEEEHPFRVAIVCAMWLTGFDVPCLSTLYLDKPLKAHTLMQAIARANRVHEGKNNGLIVDYCSILKNLREALANFAGSPPESPGDDEDPARPNEELLSDLAEAIALVRQFLKKSGASLDAITFNTGFERNAAILQCKEAANQNDETRKRFEVMCREVFKKFKACITIEAINEYREDRGAINIVYKSLQQDRELADITAILRKLHQVVDEAIEVQTASRVTEEPLYDISSIDFQRLKEEFARSPRKNTTVQCLRDAVENKLMRLLQQNPLRTNFQAHYEQLVADYNREKDQLTIEQTFEALLKLNWNLDEEERRHIEEGLDEETLAIYDLLKKPELTKTDIKRIKSVAKNLLQTLKSEKLRINQWRDKEATRDAIKTTIHDFLYDESTGLPLKIYSESDIREKSEDIYRHIFRAYPSVPSPFFPSAAA